MILFTLQTHPCDEKRVSLCTFSHREKYTEKTLFLPCSVLALYWPCTGLQCIQIKSNLRRMSQRQQEFLAGTLVFS